MVGLAAGRGSRYGRAAAVVGVVGVVAAFVLLGGYGWVRSDGNVEELLTETGVVGPLVFVGVMWATQPLGVPGFVYMAPAGVIWPIPLAIGLSWIGNMGASWLAFAFARWLARDWVADRIPARMGRFYDRLSRDAFGPVVVVRLLFGQLPPADWLLGVTRVSTRTFLVGTAIGIVPGIVVFVVAGGSLLEAAGDLSATARWIALGVLAVAIVVVRLVRRRRDRPGSVT